MNILHIHQDYPDGLPYPYTRAVANLVETCQAHSDELAHTVLSINRTSNPFKIRVKPFDAGIAVVYWGIPLPYIYYLSMWLSAWWVSLLLRRYCRKQAQAFDMIHGHKLTTEGTLAYFLAKRLSLPYVLSVRGGSDCHNLQRLSRHKRLFRAVYEGAAHIFWVSPWAKARVAKSLGVCPAEGDLFPNITVIDVDGSLLPDEANVQSGAYHFVCAISFQQYKRKGVVPLVYAAKQLSERGIQVFIDFYGSGDHTAVTVLADLIAEQGMNDQLAIHGQVSQSVLRDKMRASWGFIMPSKNETFGMSYIEALSVGCPIVYMADTGIDGYFDRYKIGVRLQEQSPEAIAESMVKLVRERGELTKGMSQLIQEGYLSMFTGPMVVKQYVDSMKQVFPC